MKHFLSRQYFEKKLGRNCSAGWEAAGNQTTSNPPPVSGCKDEFSFSNWLALLSQLPLLLFTFLNSLLYRCISDKVRILGSLTAILFLFVLTAILPSVPSCKEVFSACWGLFRNDTAPCSSAVKEWLGCLPPSPCCFPRPSFSRYYLDKRPAEDLGYELETKAVLLSPDLVADSSKGEPLNVKNGNAGVVEQDGSARPPEVMNGGSGVGMVAPNPSIFSVLKKIWLLALSIVMDFSITLSVFPAITTKVISSTQNPLWLGLRILLIPMFLLCNIPRKTGWPVLFPHDAWFVILMVAFSLSNGYFVSLTMCLAPKQVQPEESELAGAIMTFFLALGLSCGAGLSFLLRLLL
ncbi:hypothetical protein Chor_014814 [Crotalus horridus]